MPKKRKVQSKKVHHTKSDTPQKIEIPKSLEWDAPEFHFYSKSWIWLAVIVLLALLLSYLFFLLKSYLTIAVVILAAFVFWQQSNKKPKKIKVKLSKDGLEYNGRTLTFTHLKSFWVVISEHNKVYFQTTKKFVPPLTILLGKQDSLEVHNFLIQHLPEHHTPYEDLADKLGRILRF